MSFNILMLSLVLFPEVAIVNMAETFYHFLFTLTSRFKGSKSHYS